MIGIYMYENKFNHKKYIGQSTNIERRKKEHITRPSIFSRFDNELRAIGEESFIFSILEQCSVEKLDEREKYWINYYDCLNNGYNLTLGGQSYRGEENPWSKLSNNEVNEIIILLEECKLTNKEIANLYNVHYNTIDYINRCKTWTHLHEYKTNIRNENLKKLPHPHSAHGGENSKSSKLTEKIVLNIIQDIEKLDISLAAISRKYNVKQSAVQDINLCRTWTYLHNYNKNIRKEAKGR